MNMSDRVIKKRLKKTTGIQLDFYPDTKEKLDWLNSQTESQAKSMNYLLNQIIDFYWENYQE